MMRTFDAAAVNAVCAQSGMPVWCGTPERPLDLSAAVLDVRNWFFLGAGGFFGAIWRGGGLYEIHLAFGPPSRGAATIRALRIPMHRLFAGIADVMIAAIPASNLACRWLASRFGFRRIVGTLGSWEGEPLIPYAISRLMWFRSRECRQPQ